MTSTGAGFEAGRLDAAIAAREYEVVALRLALGLLAALRQAREGAGATREELVALMEELGGAQ